MSPSLFEAPPSSALLPGEALASPFQFRRMYDLRRAGRGLPISSYTAAPRPRPIALPLCPPAPRSTRSREQNRVLARRELQLRLDDTIRGAGSVRNVAAAAAIKATGRAHSRARARHALIKEQKAAAAAEAAAAAAAASVSDADAPLNGAPAASTPAAPAGGARGGGVEAAVLEVHAVAAKAPPKAALR